jgi:hypothetical protein
VAKSTPEQRVRDFYGFPFPDDFFRFREFLDGLPRRILRDACDMHPAFPFEVAAGRPAKDYPKHPHWEDRYYHDLPEFVTLFRGTTDGSHWGYFFDSPGEHPPVVAHYWHSDTFGHGLRGDTLFEATRQEVEKSESDFLDMAKEGHCEAAYARKRLKQVATIRDRLAEFWGADRPQTGDAYMKKYYGSRWRKPVAKTWDRLGIVVPRGKYRKLKADPFAGHRVDPKRREIEQLAAEAMELLAKGYPGAALKLGRDLWVWAREFPVCYSLLAAAYTALRRERLLPRLAEALAFRSDCDAER